jgi:asparagine synthase (glutamine-hydrolysing)
MSGIAGFFLRDGAPADHSALRAMAATLQNRGPDGSGTWCEGSVAVAHRMLWTTPESLSERQPVSNRAGTFVLTADARIDNRAELIKELLLTGPASTIADSDIIVAAYARWGERCPEKLIGDFAFVLWDAISRSIFCARDPMGVKSLYYYQSTRLFAFASEIKALTSLSAVPRQLNEVRVADFLVNLFEDREITFYRDVKRLPAASTLVVTADRTKLSRYWSLDPHREIRLSSDDQYAEAFRDLFTSVVLSHTRSAYPIACTLSGGLDSSSIACVAERLNTAAGRGPVHTLSAVFPGLPEADLKRIDERPFMFAALGRGSFIPHMIEADRLSPLRDVARVHHCLDEANFAPNLYLHWAMYEEASRHGIRVMLDGFDGDTTVSHGLARLPDLLVALQWRTLWRELNLTRRNLMPSASMKKVFLNMCVKPLAPLWMYRMKRLLKGQFKEVSGNSTLLEPAFMHDVGIKRRARRLLHRRYRWHEDTRAQHLQGIGDATYASALEATDKSSAAFGVEARYPFFDRRLIEFCVALPANQKFGQGWNRIILRRAMEGILPPEIQWRPRKGDLSPNFERRLLDFERQTLDEVILRDSSLLARYVSSSAMREAYSHYRADPIGNNKYSMQLFAAVNLALWLRDTALVP